MFDITSGGKKSFYTIDRDGIFQGEYKSWWPNGSMWGHCFFVNGRYHGERKRWDGHGTLIEHKFWVHDVEYRNLIENPVDEKDKFLITIETGGKWIC